MNYIDDIIKEKKLNITKGNNVFDVGKVIRVQDYIIEVKGLDDIAFFEEVNVSDKAIGYVTNIKKATVIIAVLKVTSPIMIGDTVLATHRPFMASVSKSSLGRVIDIFGYDKLVDKKFSDLIRINVEENTIPIMDRRAVKRPMLTGIAGLDLIYPIGKGQRQLIIGDKKTGKTQICLDAIVNQKDKQMVCIYVAIGKTKKEIKEIYQSLLKLGAMQYTIIVTAFNDDKPPVLVLTPYVSISLAELYMRNGNDVLVVIDDLKRHAEAYREFSLISGKTPGRDAYPADIFFVHSRMLEKGCQYKNGKSITILPIMEIKGGDITDYIATNIISITDGQIVMSSKDFQKGQKPAINYGLSVSRLGGAVQTNEVKKLGSLVRSTLLNYLETRDVYELANVDEMGEKHKQKMYIGQRILESLKQYKFSPLTEEEILNKFSFIKKDENIVENKKVNSDNADHNDNNNNDEKIKSKKIEDIVISNKDMLSKNDNIQEIYQNNLLDKSQEVHTSTSVVDKKSMLNTNTINPENSIKNNSIEKNIGINDKKVVPIAPLTNESLKPTSTIVKPQEVHTNNTVVDKKSLLNTNTINPENSIKNNSVEKNIGINDKKVVPIAPLINESLKPTSTIVKPQEVHTNNTVVDKKSVLNTNTINPENSIKNNSVEKNIGINDKKVVPIAPLTNESLKPTSTIVKPQEVHTNNTVVDKKSLLNTNTINNAIPVILDDGEVNLSIPKTIKNDAIELLDNTSINLIPRKN